MGRLRSLIDDGERFFRGSYFGYTWLLILLGAGSVNPEPSLTQIVLLICLGLNYHFFGYIHNDLIDLPLDRLQPRRATDPLVTGRISTRTAWLFALIQIPISYGLLFWGDAEPNAYLFLSPSVLLNCR